MRNLLLSIFVSALTLSGAELETVLAEMDKASASFQGMTADLRWVTHTALVDDTSEEIGRLWVKREGNGATTLRIAFEKPAEKHVLISGSYVQIYTPKINQVDEYDLSTSKSKIKQALTFGFGPSGESLLKDYEVSVTGEEEAAGVDTIKLILVPKDPEAKAKMPRLEMWVSKDSWQPVQQKLTQRGGDYRLYEYGGVAVNPPLKDADLKLKIPKKAKRVKPS